MQNKIPKQSESEKITITNMLWKQSLTSVHQHAKGFKDRHQWELDARRQTWGIRSLITP